MKRSSLNLHSVALPQWPHVYSWNSSELNWIWTELNFQWNHVVVQWHVFLSIYLFHFRSTCLLRDSMMPCCCMPSPCMKPWKMDTVRRMEQRSPRSCGTERLKVKRVSHYGTLLSKIIKPRSSQERRYIKYIWETFSVDVCSDYGPPEISLAVRPRDYRTAMADSPISDS